jgi:hypothetical protein
MYNFKRNDKLLYNTENRPTKFIIGIAGYTSPKLVLLKEPSIIDFKSSLVNFFDRHSNNSILAYHCEHQLEELDYEKLAKGFRVHFHISNTYNKENHSFSSHDYEVTIMPI